jgi:hypothetical protein
MHRGPIIQTAAFHLSGLLAVPMTEINQAKTGFALSWAARRWPMSSRAKRRGRGDIRPSLVRCGAAGGVRRPSAPTSIAGITLHCCEPPVGANGRPMQGNSASAADPVSPRVPYGRARDERKRDSFKRPLLKRTKSSGSAQAPGSYTCREFYPKKSG